MKHLKKLGLAGAIVVATCGLAGTASATTVDPATTAVTLTSTNSALTVSGSGIPVTCQHSTISGTTPSGSATWLSISATLTYSNCTAFGLAANVSQTAACHNSSTGPQLHVMSPPVAIVVTLRECVIDVNIPSTGCTLTVGGTQTVGNGTGGAGGIGWTNLSTKSVAHLNNATVPSVTSNGTGFLCPTAGAHTGTLSGTYAVASATNVTVT